MPRFGKKNEIFARAQKSIYFDERLKQIVKRRVKRFDDVINDLIRAGIDCEEAQDQKLHSPSWKAGTDKAKHGQRRHLRVNFDEYLIMALRERQESHESYSDTLNRYLIHGIECEANHQKKDKS